MVKPDTFNIAKSFYQSRERHVEPASKITMKRCRSYKPEKRKPKQNISAGYMVCKFLIHSHRLAQSHHDNVQLNAT